MNKSYRVCDKHEGNSLVYEGNSLVPLSIEHLHISRSLHVAIVIATCSDREIYGCLTDMDGVRTLILIKF